MLERILKQVRDQNVRLTQHALQEMAEEDFTLDEIVEAIASGQILEDYPRHRRGACCLVNGLTATGRPVHVVCTTARPTLIIITVYEPTLPKWVTPRRRSVST